jgi:hypothetical protein
VIRGTRITFAQDDIGGGAEVGGLGWRSGLGGRGGWEGRAEGAGVGARGDRELRHVGAYPSPEAERIVEGLQLGGAADDFDVFLRVDANALFSFLLAPFAAVVQAAHVPGALAGAAAVGAGALVEGREFAHAILLEAYLQNAVEEAVARHVGPPGVVFVHFFPGEPAFGGEFFGSDRDGLAEALAFLDPEMAVVAPDGVEGFVVALPGDVGAEEVSVEIGRDLDDGLVDDGLLFGGLKRSGTGDGEGGDLEGVEDFAGAPGVERVGKEAVGDLSGDDLDGVEVFEEGDGDFVAPGADGKAVTDVGDAELVSMQGMGAALASADGEGAAAAEGLVRGGRGDVVGGSAGIGHGGSLRRAQGSGLRRLRGKRKRPRARRGPFLSYPLLSEYQVEGVSGPNLLGVRGP